MSDQSSSRDWKDPFGPGGGETFDPDAPKKGSGIWWIVALCLIAAVVTGAFYLHENPPRFLAPERVIVVGLPETVSVVVQVDVPKTLAGLDDVLETDASGMLGRMLELLEHREGITVPLDEVEYVVAAIDEPTWMLSDRPQDEWVESMLLYVRFTTSNADSAIVPPGTPTLPSADGTTVFQIGQLLATLVDERTWLICPQGLLTKAQAAYEQDSQPAWMEAVESSESMVIAGRISGMPGPDLTQEIEVLVSGSFGRPCVIRGHCTPPRMDQARELLNELERSLDRDFNGRGAVRDTLFESANLALSGRTVNFEGTIAAEEVKLAMAPVTLMIGMMGLASIAEVPDEPPAGEPLPDGVPDNRTNQRCWELLQTARANSWRTEVVEANLTELLAIEDAPHQFVAEAHMLLCDYKFENREEHFAALREMDDVPTHIIADACKKMLLLEFDEELIIEYCSVALEREDLSDEFAAEFHVKRGRAYLPSFSPPDAEQMAHARADAESVLSLANLSDEWRAEALALRARASDDVAQQIADYRAALAIADWDAGSTLSRLHRLLRDENNLELAIECMTDVIDNEDHRERLRTEATVLRGNLKKEMGDLEGFLADNWLILEGEYDSQETAEALDRITQHYLDEDAPEAALDACTRAIAIHPDEASFEVWALETRANILMTIENYEQALAEYELVRLKNPYRDSPGRDRLARAWMGSGRALIELSRTAEALEHFQSGLDVFDEDDDMTADRLAVRIARAHLNQQLGHTDQAIAELEEVIQLSQFNSITAQAQAELESIQSEQSPQQD